MAHPLDGAHLKVERAVEHLDDLERCIALYKARDPYGVVADRDEERHQIALRVRITEPPPPRLVLLAGDGVHNLRAALDYAACELVRAGGGKCPYRRAFPVCEDRQRYETDGIREIQGARQVAMDQIEALQPYHVPEPKHHLLYMLHHLDIRDKHRLLVPAVGALAVDAYKVVHGIWTQLGSSGHRVVEDGAVLISLSDSSQVDVDTQVTLEIVFDEAGPGHGEPVLATLKQLIDFTQQVLAQFAPLL